MEPAPSSKVEEVLEEIKAVLLMRGVPIDVAEKALTFLRHSAYFCNNIKNGELDTPPPPKPKAVPPKAREVVISISGTVRKK